jgi:hypothetical protein
MSAKVIGKTKDHREIHASVQAGPPLSTYGQGYYEWLFY